MLFFQKNLEKGVFFSLCHIWKCVIFSKSLSNKITTINTNKVNAARSTPMMVNITVLIIFPFLAYI